MKPQQQIFDKIQDIFSLRNKGFILVATLRDEGLVISTYTSKDTNVLNLIPSIDIFLKDTFMEDAKKKGVLVEKDGKTIIKGDSVSFEIKK